ncbi:MAG: L-threonylcarbamoyladenylate synthase [Vicinamibacteria bacterium]|jgi:L-threonylcarbamoyladenylate synthase|nr:L-threonylcarbamoyladenylate synthase [Vicinamibacteria bacterium]
MTARIVCRANGDEATLARAVELLRAGKLLIYPTDTLYALGGLALLADVAAQVRRAKGRADQKPLPLIAADIEQARDLWRDVPASAERLMRQFWPGPLTLVLPAAAHVPEGLLGNGTTVAVRVPACDWARALCHAAGPLIATSANRAGERTAETCADVVAAVGRSAALAIDIGPLGGAASTVLELALEPRILRQGAIAAQAIQAILEDSQY